MKLDKIAEILGKNSKDIPSVDIHWLLTDSRSLAFPQETLFFALKTERNNGHLYIPELYEQQVRYFVITEWLPEFSKLSDAVFLQVDDTLEALQLLAKKNRELFSIPVIGITGSNGKTIVKEWLYQLLNEDYKITRSPRSYNSQIGVPLSVWELTDQTELGIFEAGISQKGEMENLQPIIQPTIGIITNIGNAHQDNFTNLEEKLQEKLKLFSYAETLIYHKDDTLIDKAITNSNYQGKLFSWGKTKDADLNIIEINKTNLHTVIKLNYHNNLFTINIPFSDDASLENAIHAVAVMLYLDINPERIQERIKLLEPIGMRLEVKEGINNCLLINDSYNADLASLNIALDFQDQQAVTGNLSKTIIISDIFQSGMPSEELYQKIAELIGNRNIRKVIGIGREISQYGYLFNDIENYFFSNTEDFISSRLIRQFNHELILLKGSRRFHFEDISSQLELVSHQTILEVNLNSLIDNLNYFRSKLKPETKVMSMVKAFAYGSGAIEIARTLQHHHCDYLAVALADEGVELRQEGIGIPIVVMNPEKSSFGLIFNHKLEPEIYSFNLLKSFIKEAEKLGITDYPIHIKIDSGMHRLGFLPEEINELITLIQNQRQVKIRSVFSHLAGSDEKNLDYFTKNQVEIFINSSDKITRAFPHYIMRHILNSYGIERFPEYQFDMVRLGIGHYGVNSNNKNLKPVCSLKTVILQTKIIQAGETVGYNRNGKVEKETKIAILPIGYADGFDRKLGNGNGEVFINGKRGKVIGNVSMDLCTVDITDIEAKEGDEVEIFGENITIAEMAERLETIPYEVLTSISRRVKRVYFQE